MADTLKTEQTLLAGSIPAIAGIEDPSKARMILYQAGRPVHAPMDNVGLATDADLSALITAETRSKVVNGNFCISQENGDTAATTVFYYPADQWYTFFSLSGAVVSAQRALSTTPNGSKYRLRWTVTTAQATSATLIYCLETPIEGISVADFLYGTASARQCVLRFGFKGPAGTYSVMLGNSAQNRSCCLTFTISAGQANTDTEQTLVFPGDTTGTWLVTTGIGLRLYFCVATGSTYQTATPGVWATGNFYGSTSSTNGLATLNDIFELFDVSLHLDPLATSIAPPWVMPDEAEELRACQRYWTKGTDNWSGYATISVGFATPIFFGITMRAGPAMTFVSTGNAGFPATASTATATSVQGTNANRTANGTGAAAFNDTWVANARM